MARSTEQMGTVTTAIPLPGGKVLVNDILKRRVLLFDSSFTTFTVVADSTSSTANAYGSRNGGLLPYRGDSALFVDPSSMSMLVINPDGKITRVMSAPRPQDVNSLVGGPNGSPGFDAKGKLVYRSNSLPTRMMAGRGGGPMMPDFPDSVPVVRFDLVTRSLDTAGFFKINRPKINVTTECERRHDDVVQDQPASHGGRLGVAVGRHGGIRAWRRLPHRLGGA